MEEARREQNQKVSRVLEALKQASQDLKKKPTSKTEDLNSSSIKALLELETEADIDNILSNDPNLSTLSTHLSELKSLVINLQKSKGHTLKSFLSRRVLNHEISRVAESIENEIQSWIDRETVENLVMGFQGKGVSVDEEDEKVKLLSQFESRVLQGFNRELQDLVLKWKVFNCLESVLCNPEGFSFRVREKSASAIGGLVQFNKDVFVGEVLMGPTIGALISMASTCSIQVLCTLIRSIKSPLVDELESNGEIPKIINLLSVKDPSISVIALDCVLEIGYFGRKEAIEAMLEEGLVKKLVELQRSELGEDLIDMGRVELKNEDELEKKKEKGLLERRPFASCVSRFAIQLEVGEGLRQREKRAFKLEVLRRVRDGCVCDSEAATVLAEVLWGSSH